MSSQHAAGPAERVRLLTESDTANIEEGPTRSLYCEDAGDLAFEDMHGNNVSGYTVAALSYHPLRIRKLKTGTSVNAVWGLW